MFSLCGVYAMFLCYVDESGYTGNKFNPKQLIQVMVGIFPNAYSYHKSDAEFKEIFNIINQQVPVSEIKSSEIYGGRKSWKNIRPDIRDEVIKFYFDWIRQRKHKLIIVAIDNKKFFEEKNSGNIFTNIFPAPWALGGFHIALVIQKLNRKEKNNKGKTILIFDEQKEYRNILSELIANPPDIADQFVEFDARREKKRLNQIIDTAFFVKSHHSTMAQVADIGAFFFRKHLELEFYKKRESYSGEKEKIKKWIDPIKDKFIPFSKIYLKTNTNYNLFIKRVKAIGV